MIFLSLKIQRCILNEWIILDMFQGRQESASPSQNWTVHSRCEVGGGGGCFGGVCVQSGSPDSAFVTQKRSNPVPCVSLAQHGLAI